MKEFIILGMHRTATSLIAKGLVRAGVFMGHDLIGKAQSNPWGHWEDREFVALNDRILKAAGGTWAKVPPEDRVLEQKGKFEKAIRKLVRHRQDEFKLWGWKDPRTTLTVKLYLPYLKQPHFISSFRLPLEIARSIERRDGLGVKHGLKIAKVYNERLVKFLQEWWSE